MTLEQPTSSKAATQFALASLVARIMLGYSLALIALIAITAWSTKGFATAASDLVTRLPQTAILIVFIIFVPKGGYIATITFALFCAWGMIDSFSGGSSTVVSIFIYLYGTLCFVGIAGVVQGFKKATP